LRFRLGGKSLHSLQSVASRSVSPSASRPKWRCRSRSSPSFSRQSRLVLTPHSWWRSVQVSRTCAGRSSVGPFTHPPAHLLVPPPDSRPPPSPLPALGRSADCCWRLWVLG